MQISLTSIGVVRTDATDSDARAEKRDMRASSRSSLNSLRPWRE